MYFQRHKSPKQTYKDPKVKGKDKITVKFHAKPGYDAGAVYGLKTTSDLKTSPHYMYY